MKTIQIVGFIVLVVLAFAAGRASVQQSNSNSPEAAAIAQNFTEGQKQSARGR